MSYTAKYVSSVVISPYHFHAHMCHPVTLLLCEFNDASVIFVSGMLVHFMVPSEKL
uniref:Uncharacterized protein n=1 Tax=Arundo donax TaxID=35708 RepID=A0A0A9HK19_ARUDO